MLIKNNFGGFKKPEAFDVFVFSGADSFVYTNIKDAGDTIADFEVGTDKIVLGNFSSNMV
ncbi:MAG: hypothetical protein RMZ69_35100 [Nostoc sp. ChiQUE01a]|nr:hypothetical protein [Nostoc sp. ChiQUE01a]